MKFKDVNAYIDYWDNFFMEWIKDPKGTFNNDKIWSNHKGKFNSGKGAPSTKLEYSLLPQPYLGDIKNHSAITLNLNPSRSINKTKEIADFKKTHFKDFKNVERYYQYAKTFPTNEISFWRSQINWFKRMSFNNNEDGLLPFAIEICPWNSESWLKLKINKEIIGFLDENIFNVIEKASRYSKIKMIFSVGKAYYEIFKNEESGFKKIEEFSKFQDTNPFELDIISEKKDRIIKITNSWSIKKQKGRDFRYKNRSFSIWEKNNIKYFNTWSPGSNKPPSKDFDNVLNLILKDYN